MACLVSVFCLFATQAGAKSPNIILIMADDVGYECFGCYGSQQYRTPNLDRLAAEGLRFRHCYSQPLCTPSRVKIMTGLSNARNYAAFSILRRDQKTFAHYLKDAGYTTVIGGKWQLLGAENYSKQFRGKGSLPQQMGFDRHCLWQVEKLGDRYWNPRLTIDGEAKQFSPDDYGPEIVTSYLLDFMTEHAQDHAPMFVYYPMILVHNPFLPTPDSESRQNKDQQQNFEDMVAFMDRQVGRIIDRTRELGIADETLILFTGDNGTNKAITSELSGQTIRGGKGNTSDSGTREPLIACWPGTIKPGQVTDQLVDISDFLPTLQEVAGAPVPDGLDGISFAQLLKGKDGPARSWMYCFYHPRPERGQARRFVRDHTWKLYGDGSFFNIHADVDEKSPLPPSAEPEVYRKLKAALDSMPAQGQTLLKFD
ncbi:sulfatase-like hydrolase/transferase [bacterium]|nr:sulfatase-like hydrolase/transferase [bacterium]